MPPGPFAVHRLQSIACLPIVLNVRAHANVQKINESWMCEEEPEALERSATAKVGMCCWEADAILAPSFVLAYSFEGRPEAVGRTRATANVKP